MSYYEFIIKMQKRVQNALGKDYVVNVIEVPKVNGIILQGLCIKKESSQIAPTIYLEKYYENYKKGQTFQEILNLILMVYHENNILELSDIIHITDYQKCRENVFMKLIHFQKNSELLREMPFIPFLNLAIVFYVKINNESVSNATILIRFSNLKYWSITQEELYKDAKRNTQRLLPCSIQTMEEIIAELMRKEHVEEPDSQDLAEKMEQRCIQAGEVDITEQMQEIVKKRENDILDKGEARMFILTNVSQMFGATSILYENVLQNCAEILNHDLYILPSSIHEVIIIPDEGHYSKDALLLMVKDVNDSQVKENEWLADSVYYYDKQKKNLYLCAGE